MKRKLKTIQSSLFFTYSFIIILVLLIFVSFFYIWISNVLREKSIESINNLSFSFQEKIDNEIQKMDGVSTNILYSNLVKKNFVKYLASETKDSSLKKPALLMTLKNCQIYLLP